MHTSHRVTGAGIHRRIDVAVMSGLAAPQKGVGARSATILIPVYNDWASLIRLLHDIDAQLSGSGLEVAILAVDDGSIEPPDGLDTLRLEHVRRVDLIRLVCNVGHQRAIAVGLVEAASMDASDVVIVMDSDGEDRPAHLVDLLAAHEEGRNRIVVAQRLRRSEGPLFRAGYSSYRLLFRALTGRSISFGNFCLIPRRHLERLVHSPELWSSLCGSLVRSRLPIVSVATTRGFRYAGRSSMSFTSLVLHGLGNIAVYSDAAFVRILIGSLGLSAATVLGMLSVVAVRVLTDRAVPGWASNVMGSLAIILLQALMFSTGATFLLLANRSTTPVVPATEAPRYVHARETLFTR